MQKDGIVGMAFPENFQEVRKFFGKLHALLVAKIAIFDGRSNFHANLHGLMQNFCSCFDISL